MNKEIYINGINVSGCYFLNKGITNLLCTCPSEIDEECKDNPNCYYKQHQRKTTECEKYEQALNDIELLSTNLISSCDKCEDNKNGYCIGINECSSRCFKNILNIIKSAKDTNVLHKKDGE